MNIKAQLKKNILPLSLILSFFIFFFLCSVFTPTVDVLQLKKQYNVYFNIWVFIVAFIPLVWLFLSDIWKESSGYRKVLLVSLTMFILSTTFGVRFGINCNIIFIICSILFLLHERKIYISQYIFYLFSLYFLIHLASLLWVNDTTAGLKEIRIYLPFFLIPLAFCFFSLQKKEINTILLIFYKSIFIFIFLSLCTWVYQSYSLDIPFANWFRLIKSGLTGYPAFEIVFSWSNYSHPTYVGISYLFALALAFYFYEKKEKRISLFELLIVVLTTLLLLIITQSRVGFVIWLSVVFLGIGYLLRSDKKVIIVFFTLGLISGIVLVLIFQTKIDSFLNDPERKKLNEIAFYFIKKHPIEGIGVGEMPSAIYSDEIEQSLGYPDTRIHSYPHNQFIGDWMQTGIFGLITILTIIISLLIICFKRKDWLLFMFLIILFQVMLIEMPLNLYKGIIYFVLFSCLLLQRGKQSKVLFDFNKKN